MIVGSLAGCMVCLIIVAALIGNFVPSDNKNALNAIMAIIFIYVIFYEGGLDGTQFAYLVSYSRHICEQKAWTSVLWASAS